MRTTNTPAQLPVNELCPLLDTTSSGTSSSGGGGSSYMDSSSSVAGPSSSGPVRYRDKNARGESVLHVAAIKGDYDQVKRHLDQGVNPNVTDNAGGWRTCSVLPVSGLTDCPRIHSRLDSAARSLQPRTLQRGEYPD